MIIQNLEGKKVKEIKLPEQFNESYHPDLIKRAVLAIRANKRQPYGATSRAGKRASVKISKRRHDYRSCYGRGISRAPRKVTWRRGTQFGWVGSFAPGTVGGRKAHPPKPEKNWNKKINIKEKRKAIRSALSATVNLELIKQRNHITPKNYPFIIDSKIEDLQKTKEVKSILKNLGFNDELKRVSVKKVRAGKGKSRGRKYKKKTGPLIVVSSKCKLIKSATNIPGINIIEVNKLNTELLAPGAQAGRLTLFT
ncbi:MAG: 50S ribosomal protein L4, partial [Nanoarchaeota archaeon]|nr:50S ribosomal protein L4 [Nanoarchaeota archaeon]